MLPKEKGSAPMTDTPLRTLLIEDQLDIQMILKITLEKSKNFTVVTAATGKDGISLATTQKPDLIILDFSLPDMEGPEILKVIKTDPATAYIPVIMLTARTGDLSTDDCKKNGATDVLFKPFDPRTIANQLLKLYQSTRS
jgi:CheY-like chemotaxis protein